MAETAAAWIVNVMGEEAGASVRSAAESSDADADVVGALMAALKDGVLLCRLVEQLSPASGPPPSLSPLPFHQMENVAAYLEASARLGVRQHDQFMVSDLFEAKAPRAVLTQLLALKRLHAGREA